MHSHASRIARNLILEAAVALPALLASSSVHDYLAKHSATAAIVGVVGAALESLVTAHQAKTTAGV